MMAIAIGTMKDRGCGFLICATVIATGGCGSAACSLLIGGGRAVGLTDSRPGASGSENDICPGSVAVALADAAAAAAMVISRAGILNSGWASADSGAGSGGLAAVTLL